MEAIILGIVQGITEFLPISSSAHLLVLPKLLGWTSGLINSMFFDVALHLGTLLAVLIYFRSDIAALTSSGFSIIRNKKIESTDEKLFLYIIISAIPAVLAGLFLGDLLEKYARSNFIVVFTLIAVGLLMLYAERFRESGRVEITARDAVLIGIFQALALVPGVSRSGITIATGLFLGLKREQSARFSFLMAVPVIFGAVVFEGAKAMDNLTAHDITVSITGVFVSFLAGYLAIKYLLAYVKTNRLDIFAYYRFIVAIIVAFFTL